MDAKPGWKTTEFWLTILTLGLSLLFKGDTGAAAQVVSVAAPAVATGAYAISRAMTKGADSYASAPVGVVANVPAVDAAVPDPQAALASVISTVAAQAATQALTTALGNAVQQPSAKATQ